MIFSPTPIEGAYIIEPLVIQDIRGSFQREWCIKELKNKGLCFSFVQCNSSFNKQKGTLRGLHYQMKPYQEVKLIKCVSGSFYDVIVDLRPESLTYKETFGIVLSSRNKKSLYVPKGCAHGYQTLEDNTEALYHVSEYYTPDAEQSIIWNDPTLNIQWPLSPSIISPKDLSNPQLES